MKKQNLTNNLAFNKAIVTELNQNELNKINGGTGIYLPSSVIVMTQNNNQTKEISKELSKQF
jgi:bacteriocin-like protein